MTDDLVKRLRDFRMPGFGSQSKTTQEAADRIDALEAEVRTARKAALEEAAQVCDDNPQDYAEELAKAIRALAESEEP